MEIAGVLQSTGFLVILAFGVLNMIGNSFAVDRIFGTAVHPVTHLMVNILQGAFLIVVLVIVTVYSGELVWRERTARVQEVIDALPVPNWALWGAKLAALAVVVAAMLATAILTGIGIQAARGYYAFEIGVYLRGMLVLAGIPFVLAAVLAVFLQVVTNNRYLGYLLMLLYFISGPVLSAWDFNHNLYQYAQAPTARYSDMNGFGHFVEPLAWFSLYWTFAAGMLAVAIHLLWIRGVAGSLRDRLRLARQRFTRPVGAVLAVLALGFAGTGSYIFYNTNVLNEYIPGDLREERQARYEQQYKQYEGIPQPKITALYADVDIYPERRAVDIRGRYNLRNKTGTPVDELHLSVNPQVTVRSLDAPGLRLRLDDDTLGYRIYDLDAPLAPGDSMELSFEVAIENPGFVNHGSNIDVVRNGTFFHNVTYFPRIGYSRRAELGDPNDRRRLGLVPIQRMPSIDDAAARENHYITSESDWIDFETVVSTSPDQIALAPGYLQREWTEDGRRHFHYKMDAPILGLVAWLSADWQVARDRWNDVNIEIYHHRTHRYNVDRMIDAVKKSLDYLTGEFAPYQHRQVRIVEFPRYRGFAQSLPNTIPYSESIGFIARLRRGRRRGDRLRLLRHRPRGGAPVVGAPGGQRQCAGGDRDVGDDVAVRRPDDHGARVRPRADASLPQVRARQLSQRARRRADRGAAAAAGREPGLHPLPQGQPGHVRPARLRRRGGAEHGAEALRRGGPLSGTALHLLARVPVVRARGGAARDGVDHRGSVRDHHPLRQPPGGGDP